MRPHLLQVAVALVLEVVRKHKCPDHILDGTDGMVVIPAPVRGIHHRIGPEQQAQDPLGLDAYIRAIDLARKEFRLIVFCPWHIGLA